MSLKKTTDSDLAQALHAYYGTAALWSKIFSANPGTESTYVSDIRVSSPQQFLYYAMLELEHPSDMRNIVNQRQNQSVGLWLAAVQQHFGAGYYSQLEAALMDAGNSSSTWAYQLGEQHIYGSSRVGLIERNLPLGREAATAAEVNYVSAAGDSSYVYSYQSDSILIFHRGQKRYELSNHLGNVLAVITDRRIQRCNVAGLMYYDAQVVSVSDYYPFGMGIKEREWKDSAFGYRYGFNGFEKDDEVKGSGNAYTTEYRMYDSRLGRWFSIDPMYRKYPSHSPYNYCVNSPILFKDAKGDDPITAFLEGVIAFGLEAGLDFVTAYVLEDKTVEQSFNSINWWGASWEGAKSTALAIASPSGLVSALKIKKLSKSKVGKIAGKLAFSMSEEVMKNYMNGAYDDKDGNFDSEKINFEEAFYVALIDVLISEGFAKKAKKIVGELDGATQDVLKQKGLMDKLINGKATQKVKEAAGSNRRDKLIDAAKKVEKAEVKKTALKAVQEGSKKGTEEVVKEVAGT